MLTPGTVIDGRYRIDEEIGAGGFATVFAAHHLNLNARVAIKVLRLYPEDSHERRAELLRGFADEARLVMRLRHDYVVRTLDQGVYQPPTSNLGLPYVVLEWCGDSSLAAWLDNRRGRGMQLAEAYGVIEAIASGMAHAHELGIAHRDLKPSNVMLARDPRGALVPRIIDFGIAKLFESDRRAGGMLTTSTSPSKYTPAYAAPEQLAGLATGPWTDVHAIGLLFVELVTGHLPYDRSSLGPIDPNRPTPKSFGIDVGAFEQVIFRAVAFDPRHRYQDAGELLRALREASKSAIVANADTVYALSSPFASAPPVAHVARSNAPSASTGSPLVHTVRQERRPVIWAAPLLLAPIVVVACAVLLAIVMWPKTHARIARSTSALAARPLTAIPDPAPARTAHLSDMTPGDLEERLTTAGCRITGRGQEQTVIYLHFTSAKVEGTAYVNNVPSGLDLPSEGQALATLPTIKGWIAHDRAAGFELAYGVDGDYVLSMTGKSKQPTLELFEELARGYPLGIRGSSFGSPDPANNPQDLKALWRAKSLDDLEESELYSRIITTGTRVVEARFETSQWTLSLVIGKNEGELNLFWDNQSGADALVDDLKKRRTPFAKAGKGSTRIVGQGPGELGTQLFLKRVLAGLDAPLD